MTAEEKGEAMYEFLSAHWGGLSDRPYTESAPMYFGSLENFEGLINCALVAPETDEPARALASLLIASLKAAYDLGRESMLQ